MNNTQTNRNNLLSNKVSNAHYEDVDNNIYEQKPIFSPSTTTICAIFTSSSKEQCPHEVELDDVIVPRYIGDGSINYNHKKAMELVIRRLIQLEMNK